MSEMMLQFPVGNAKVEKAFDVKGDVIGVSIIMLVLPEDFEKLPDLFRGAAKHVFSALSSEQEGGGRG